MTRIRQHTSTIETFVKQGTIHFWFWGRSHVFTTVASWIILYLTKPTHYFNKRSFSSEIDKFQVKRIYIIKTLELGLELGLNIYLSLM